MFALPLTLALAAGPPPARLVLTPDRPVTFEVPAPPAGHRPRLTVAGLSLPPGDSFVRVYVNDPTAGPGTGASPRLLGTVNGGHEPAVPTDYALNPAPALRRLAAERGHNPAAPLRLTLVLIAGRGEPGGLPPAATLVGIDFTAEPPGR